MSSLTHICVLFYYFVTATSIINQKDLQHKVKSYVTSRASRFTEVDNKFPLLMHIPKNKLIPTKSNPFDSTKQEKDGKVNMRRENRHKNTDNQNATLLNDMGYDIQNANDTLKRKGYLSWDDYFMAIAALSGQRSKDPTENAGACIADGNNRIVGIGYNGFPRGCSDDLLPWAPSSSLESCSNKKIGSILHTKDPYMCEAEINAILNKYSTDVSGSRLYVKNFPRNESAKMIIQSGISEIVYIKLEDPSSNPIKAAQIMFSMAGVKLRQYIPSRPSPVTPLNFTIYDTPSSTTKSGQHQEVVNDEKNESFRHLLIKEANFDPMNTARIQKRHDYLSWDDYFTAVACLSAQRSKDPNTQVGCCIVDTNKCIVGIGYNGFPRGCSDDYFPWARVAKNDLHTKYPYVVHAEVNAILNKGSKDVKGATLYVALFPCNECAKVIIQSGIKEVVFLSDKYRDTDSCRASRILFEMAGVHYRQHIPSKSVITIDLET